MTPAVRFLSILQKNHLQSMPFFDDDPNLSFPGFREDMKDQPQVSTTWGGYQIKDFDSGNTEDQPGK